MNTVDYASFTLEQLEKEFSTSSVQGLSQNQVTALLQKYGKNSLEERVTPWWSILLRQFKSSFVYLLTGAAVLSFFLGDPINGFTISAIILINALLSFYQEYKAEQALKLLQEHLTMSARVLREGTVIRIDNQELVPGDIVILQTGDYIPADIVLFEGSLDVNESILTGEAMPVKKEALSSQEKNPTPNQPVNVCFFSTTITAGSAKGIVVATGSRTMFGEIGHLTIETVQQSGFQERIAHLSRFILILTVGFLVCLFFFHLLVKGIHTDLVQLALFALALTLGLTPEALPTVITFALSRGAVQLVHHNVVVKRLSAIEDLGAITVLCTDKTGTLTENNLSVSAVFEQEKDSVIRFMLLASKKGKSADPFDQAVIKAATTELIKEQESYHLIKETPFSPETRRNEVLIEQNGTKLLIARGAFESIAQISAVSKNVPELQTWISAQSAEGNRVLAVAYKNGDKEEDFTFVGLAAFYDPIKSTTKAALIKARALGVTVKMVTGDSPEVAQAVARQIDLDDAVITGQEFELLSLEEKHKALQTYTLFARILPKQKYDIINLLKEGNTVGFVGEGINDAPALKTAHVGLAVKGATDIAQDAADIILLNKSLLVIIKGIAIGRTVFSNTMKYLLACLSSTFGNCYSIAIASLLINFLPLLPLQILLINMLSDLPMVAIATDTVDADKIRIPQPYDLGSLAFAATLLGITSSVFDFITFALFYKRGPLTLQTNWFIESILTELVLIYSVRTKGAFYKAVRPSMTLLSISITVACITILLPFTYWGHTIFKFKAPTAQDILAISVIVIAYFFTTELVKLLYNHYVTTSPKNHKKHHRSLKKHP